MVNHNKPIVAIFGGSFDPPHKGHQRVVEKALETLDIEKLLVVPAFLNPFKSSTLASPSLRLSWCHILFDDMPKVEVNDYEIKEGKKVPTSQSVKYFNQAYTVTYLIVGSDNLSTLTTWHEFEWLNEHIIWVIATREHSQLDTKMLKKWCLLSVDTPISSTQIRNTKELHYIDKKIQQSVKQHLKGQHLMTIDQRIENIVKLLDDKKAEEIEVFNLDNADYIAKRVVIANSLNGKHTLALFDHLKKELRTQGDTFLASDATNEWAVADLGDILIHIMTAEYRQRYSLETFLSELVETQKKKNGDPA